jgi:hypothetical protein
MRASKARAVACSAASTSARRSAGRAGQDSMLSASHGGDGQRHGDDRDPGQIPLHRMTLQTRANLRNAGNLQARPRG